MKNLRTSVSNSVLKSNSAMEKNNKWPEPIPLEVLSTSAKRKSIKSRLPPTDTTYFALRVSLPRSKTIFKEPSSQDSKWKHPKAPCKKSLWKKKSMKWDLMLLDAFWEISSSIFPHTTHSLTCRTNFTRTSAEDASSLPWEPTI